MDIVNGLGETVFLCKEQTKMCHTCLVKSWNKAKPHAVMIIRGVLSLGKE